MTDQRFKGIIVHFTGTPEYESEISEELTSLGTAYQGRWFSISVLGIAKLRDYIIAFNRRAQEAMRAGESQQREESTENREQKIERMGPDLDLAIRDEFSQIPLKDVEDVSYYQAYVILRQRLFIGLNQSELDVLDRMFASFVDEKVHDGQGLTLNQSLDEKLTLKLKNLLSELKYPIYPADPDSKLVQILRYFASFLPYEIPLDLGPAPQRGEMQILPTSLLVVAVDDNRTQLEEYRAELEGKQGIDFYGFSSVEMARDFLKNNPVGLLLIDVAFNGSYVGKELVEIAIRKARQSGTQFDLIVATGLESSADPVTKVLDFAKAFTDVRSATYAHRSSWLGVTKTKITSLLTRNLSPTLSSGTDSAL